MAKSFGRRAAALAAVGVLTLSGCTIGEPSSASDDGRPVVLTTFTVVADLARVVAGDRLRVESLTKVGAEVHGYEPTPDDLRRAEGADLIVANGLGLERWFDQFTERLDVPRVTLSEGVEPIAIAGDAYEGLPNPHAWMSPVNAQIYVANLATAFADLDPAHASDYAANATAYSEQLQSIQDELVTELGALPPDQRALVTCEGAFSYLARDTGLTEAYIWPVNAEQQATPQRVAATVDAVRDGNIPAVFCESTVSSEAMEQVAREAGSTFAGTLYVDSLSAGDGPVPTYLDLLRHDADIIVAGLTGAGS